MTPPISTGATYDFASLMRPRMYGSSESHSLRTSTSPSAGCGSGASSMRKFSGVTAPWGRLARSTRLLAGMALSPGRFGETLEVKIHVAEFPCDDGEAAERVAHLELVAHAHAAVELHRFLADAARGVGDLDLRRRNDARALRGVRFGVDARAREARHGARLLAFDHHVDHAVLQRLEETDGHAELLARLQVLERRVVRGLHRADRFGALERRGVIDRFLDDGTGIAPVAQAHGGRCAEVDVGR